LIGGTDATERKRAGVIEKVGGLSRPLLSGRGGDSNHGYGHRILPGETFRDGIPEAQAAALLTHDVLQAEDAVKRLVKVELMQGQFDALVDFVYNLGAPQAGGVHFAS